MAGQWQDLEAGDTNLKLSVNQEGLALPIPFFCIAGPLIGIFALCLLVP